MTRNVAGNLPNNPSIRKFGCPAYLHTHKERGPSKLADHAQLGIYLGTRNGLFRIHLWKQNRVVEANHVNFDETWYPRQKKDTYVGLSQPEQNMECVTPAGNEMRMSHTRSEELSVSTSTNERDEADEVRKEIEGHTERVEVEEGAISVGADGNSDNLSKEYSAERVIQRRSTKVQCVSQVMHSKGLGMKTSPPGKKL